MAIFPFYNNDDKAYTINDADYGCQKIIIAECDGGHRYATLCELIQDCPSVRQLTKDCVVNFLNNPTSYSNGLPHEKRFVRVTSDGCLELADPCVCNDGDRYVAATDDDNDPGPLDRKVKGSCSYDGLYCIDIEEAGPQTLVRRPSGPNGPFINPALPSDECEDGKGYNVKLVKNGGDWEVDFECPEEDTAPQYCRCIWQVGRAATSCKDRTVRYYLPHRNCDIKPVDSMADDAESYIDGDWNCTGTDAFEAPLSYGVVTINKPGVYEIAYSTYITFGQTLHSIRCGLYYNDGSGPKEINDIKYQTGEYWTEGNPEIFNRCWPEEWNKEKFIKNGEGRYKGAAWTIDFTGLPFARTYVLNVVNTPVEILMAVKPDMRGTDPRLMLENDQDYRYYIQVEGQGSSAYGAVTTIDIAKVSNSVHPSRMKIIK